MSKQKNKKHSTTKHTHKALLETGVLEITRSGIGYVVIANGTGDILVRQGNFNTALHGDTVTVKVIKESSTTKKKRRKNCGCFRKKANRICRSPAIIN